MDSETTTGVIRLLKIAIKHSGDGMMTLFDDNEISINDKSILSILMCEVDITNMFNIPKEYLVNDYLVGHLSEHIDAIIEYIKGCDSTMILSLLDFYRYLVDVSQEYCDEAYSNTVYTIMTSCINRLNEGDKLDVFSLINLMHQTGFIVNDIIEKHIVYYKYINTEMYTERIIIKLLTGLSKQFHSVYIYIPLFRIVCEHFTHMLNEDIYNSYLQNVCDTRVSNLYKKLCEYGEVACADVCDRVINSTCPISHYPEDVERNIWCAQYNKDIFHACIRSINYGRTALFKQPILCAYASTMNHDKDTYNNIKKNYPYLWKELKSHNLVGKRYLKSTNKSGKIHPQ